MYQLNYIHYCHELLIVSPSCHLSLYRVGPHLCSLFVDLWPVGLQSDDSVELVQCQVSILYVLAWRQRKRRQLYFVDINLIIW